MDLKERRDDKKWTDENTLLMLSLYAERKNKFRKGKRNKWIWEEISNELRYHGMDIDTVQLDRKFRNLKKTFEYVRKRQKSNKKSQDVKWRFYNEMEDLLKDVPEVVDEEDEELDSSYSQSPIMDSHIIEPMSPPQPIRIVAQRKPHRLNRTFPNEMESNCQAKERHPSRDEISIDTRDEALKHLRALQEYAMIQDNFRAIGLLMQAEQAIECPPKSKDFEE
ncbi:uncharacterized protein Dana_GF24069 [Drosophila ananassae]|uniref:Myb/SANT-like DNA-binding domain-containing protein n=2 Tax=Drosophila ananassae TaxID=7217 RepID=B3MAE6_DROAN|nr:uncharacterized protein Dana_GF24069 [Drosophila ananassae]